MIIFLLFSHGVWLSPLDTAATVWPIVPAPDDRWWWWLCSSRWNANWQGTPKYLEKTCLNATLSTTNPTWLHRGSNPGRRWGKPATEIFLALFDPEDGNSMSCVKVGELVPDYKASQPRWYVCGWILRCIEYNVLTAVTMNLIFNKA
jgi:hypothetical protein